MGCFFFSTMYLINHLLTPVFSILNPSEKLFSTKPDYTFLKAFGFRCYTMLKPYNSIKLAFKSTPCIFLGYGPNNTGIKCLAPNGKVYVSRHVNFDETSFPYSTPTLSKPIEQCILCRHLFLSLLIYLSLYLE